MFFFKQKTAYERRISDWSSDVCSSDLLRPAPALEHREHLRREGFVEFDEVDIVPAQPAAREQPLDGGDGADAHAAGVPAGGRPAMEPAAGFEPGFVEFVLGHDEPRRGGVLLPARLARGHPAPFAPATLARRVRPGDRRGA